MYPGKRFSLLFEMSVLTSRYFPVRTPPANGEYASSPTLQLFGWQTSTRSTVMKQNMVKSQLLVALSIDKRDCKSHYTKSMKQKNMLPNKSLPNSKKSIFPLFSNTS